MPFDRPTLTDLRQQTAADIMGAAPGTDALLRFSNLRIMGRVQAGLTYGLYGYLDWISKQATPFYSTDEYQAGWAALKNVFQKSPAYATGPAGGTMGTPGTVVDEGTELTRGDGVTYTTVADATVAGDGTIAISVIATDAGAAGNSDPGTILSLGTAISGVQSNFTVSSPGLRGGTDLEDPNLFRTRMLQKYQSPPQGGAINDYLEWATAVPGVTRAWVTPNGMGVGTVLIYTMFDATESAHGGFPQGTNGVASAETRASPATGDQLAVANSIFPLRPVTALVYSAAPTANPVPFTISGLASAPSSVQTAVEAAISSIFTLNGSPGGVYGYAEVDLSDIEGAIDAVAGTEGFVIESPTTNISSSAGALPILGTITWV
jgi:uncharacterized phage protein gp47/JayE